MFCFAYTFKKFIYLPRIINKYFTGLRRQLVILLSSVINDSARVKNDNAIREMLTFLALHSEPNNIDVYFDINNDGFNRRYNTYLKEIGKLKI